MAPQVWKPKVVLVDASVLYARIFRDYLLYSASEGIISITWSGTILDEMVEHLQVNIPGFNAEGAEVLKLAMNDAYPAAQVDPGLGDYERLLGVQLPDEGDRHVLAAAIAAEADIICTSNTKDFPESVTSLFGIGIMTPDELLSMLIENHPEEMVNVHWKTISRLRGATNETTLAALKRAGANSAAQLMGQKLA